MKIACSKPESVVKRAFFLAYVASDMPHGIGRLQQQPVVTEDQVWKCVRNADDYGPGAAKLMKSDKPGEAYGDYVFGRMMKLGLRWDKDGIDIDDERVPRRDYQSWCVKFPTYQMLIEAAILECA